MKNTIALLFFSAILIVGCDNVLDSSSDGVSGEWLIPKDQIFDGGPGKDGIPALQNPELLSISSISYLNDNDLVIIIRFGNTIKVYPHAILDWHEIINDGIDNHKFAITYCPLTGSATAWNRILNGTETTFGVSGLLYNSNLIPYDRATNSNWSQMEVQSVNGSLIGTEAETYSIIETTWKTLKALYPAASVVSTNTGISRNYGSYPYGDYRTNHNSLLFPVSTNDERLDAKLRVLGIVDGSDAIAHQISSFGNENFISNETINGKQIVVIGNSDKNFAAAFYRNVSDGKQLVFTPLQNMLPIVMEDNEGNKWDFFGRAVEGSRTGEELDSPKAFIAYWFAWAAFYPNTSIANN
ncbi:MAG: DUF3179 domain-containing protein [Ignavibacteriae bacterium]|nr:DUF3179 domain-containing protein [Ignavibacteriota bacterium]NOH00294.1 DUF3179 domain-containing protein [Ignavibacteriota bacterium]